MKRCDGSSKYYLVGVSMGTIYARLTQITISLYPSSLRRGSTDWSVLLSSQRFISKSLEGAAQMTHNNTVFDGKGVLPTATC